MQKNFGFSKKMSNPALLLSLSLVSVSILPAMAEKAEHLPVASHHQVSLKKFNGANISFSYPASWKPKEKDNEETIIKLAGDIGNGAPGELTVALNKSEEVDAESLKDMVSVYLKKLDDFKVIQEKKVAFGRLRNLEGLLKDVSFSMNGIKMFQRLVIFDTKNGTYSCAFITVNNAVKKAAPSFNRILMSFDANASNSARTSVDVKKETQHIHAKNAPISFSYPNGWKVVQTTGNKALELNGKDAAGKPATIAVYKGNMHPYTNLNQVAQLLEQEHLASNNKYRRLNSQTRTFGSMAKINGIVQECKYEANGVPYNQLVAYFNDSANAYVLTMASPNWKLSEMRRTFHKVLASLKMKH